MTESWSGRAVPANSLTAFGQVAITRLCSDNALTPYCIDPIWKRFDEHLVLSHLAVSRRAIRRVGLCFHSGQLATSIDDRRTKWAAVSHTHLDAFVSTGTRQCCVHGLHRHEANGARRNACCAMPFRMVYVRRSNASTFITVRCTASRGDASQVRLFVGVFGYLSRLHFYSGWSRTRRASR